MLGRTLGLLALLSCAYHYALGAPTVTVKNGTYTGVSVSSFKQEHFLGVPYALPPLPPDLRFRAPQPLNTSWNGTRAATAYSPICIGYPDGANDDAGYELSEDCLTLNVVRPVGVEAGSNTPVMVWIYGGGFAMGGSADLRYNGSWIVERSVAMGQPIIFASLNYRVNVFGFLYSEEVAEEGTGNFGLLDQHLALQWIHENIHAFGGDPSKVTIMGESAGAISVALQLHAFGQTSTDLFRAGIMESGTAMTWNYKTPAEYQDQFDTVATALGCTDRALDCLRAAPLDDLITVTNMSNMAWGPTVDGVFLKELPTPAIEAGRIIQVPVLIGQNTDEGTAFGPTGMDNASAIAAALLASYPHLANASISKILDLYPDDAFVGCPYNTGDGVLDSGAQDKRAFSIYGDVFMHAGRRMLAQAIAHGGHDVFSYRFDQVPAGLPVEVSVTHFQEVAYVFSNPLPTQKPLSTRPGDAELAELMTSFWVSFVHNLDPNQSKVKDALTWPSYRTQAANVVFKRQGSFVEKDDYRKEGIAFINSLGAQLEH